MPLRVLRLGPNDVLVAKRLFKVMAAVFDEESEELSDAYVLGLLSNDRFWAVAALAGDEVVGGVTAHTLPMTRSESSEIFVYDIAVQADHQRRGIGKQLMTHLRTAAGSAGVHDLFVLADDEDVHALDFYRALGGAAAPVTAFSFEQS